MATKLEILICTINDGIIDAAEVVMPLMEGVGYVISWQQTPDYSPCTLPDSLLRSDVKVVAFQGKGLSQNRNAALSQASADVCLIADDDLRYDPDGIREVIRIFEDNPSLDFATFRYRSASHSRHYPGKSIDLRQRCRFYSPVSFEFALRPSRLREKGVTFNELFGLAAPMLSSGEEDILLLDMLSAGLKGKFFPIDIVTHDEMTTSATRASQPGVIMAHAIIIAIYRPNTWLAAFLLEAWRAKKHYGVDLSHSMNYFIKGLKYARRHSLLKYDIKKLFLHNGKIFDL